MKIVLILFGILLFAGVLCIVFTMDSPDRVKQYPYTQNPHIRPFGTTEVIAHRSGADLAPENTMMAFENCIQNRREFDIYGFEFDLHLTSDNEIIVLHDDTLDRTSNAEEYFGKTETKPCDFTYAQLHNLNMGEKFIAPGGALPYRGLRGEFIPKNLRPVRLRDVFAYLAPYGNYTFTVDIKNEGEAGFRAADELYKILKEFNLLDKTSVASFHKSNIRYLDAHYPDITRSATVSEVVRFYLLSLFKIPVKKNAFRYKFLHIPYKDYFFNLGTTRLVNYAHAHDIAVQYWTINEPKIMLKLKSINADGIITDNPDLADEVLFGNKSNPV